MSESKRIDCDVCVIGSGLAGMAAAHFAAARNLRVAHMGHTAETIFASGLLDLLAVYPAGEKRLWRNPWAALNKLNRNMPDHPYARLKKEDIIAAFDEILDHLKEAGLVYQRHIKQNSSVLTALGTVKQTYAVPHTMWNGVKALQKKPACLIIDIRGLKGFSARQITTILKPDWPELRSARITFPGMAHLSEVYAERMANALLLAENREELAAAVSPLLKKSKVLGLPAILGLHRTGEIMSHLESLIGVPIFEIPTMPPSVPGIRLNQAFEKGLRLKDVQYFSLTRALQAHPTTNGHFQIQIGRDAVERIVRSNAIILATGRFIGGGLHANRKYIRESIFNLPVYQPTSRADWHRRDLLDPRGHLINQAGLKVDCYFRPLDDSERPAFKTLFAVGSILAHNDWKRLKCGAGVAIASAYGAVNSMLKLR